jgi:hypothetical protein
VEKRELSKIDFELIDDAFKVLLQSKPDPAVADKIADLRNKFCLARLAAPYSVRKRIAILSALPAARGLPA